MLRLLPVILLSTLLGLGVVGGGFATDAPTIVLFVFVGCLGLFIAALTAGALPLREH
jgi:4-hydroxybenzoate polyprenyltransferase